MKIKQLQLTLKFHLILISDLNSQTTITNYKKVVIVNIH